MRKRSVLIAIGMLFSFIACGGGGGSDPTYSISGTVTLTGSGYAGVTVELSGDNTDSTVTDSNGEYSFASLSDGSFTVTPSLFESLSAQSEAVTIAGVSKSNLDFGVSEMIWFVDINSSTNTPDGLSWNTSFLHPQNGVDMASSGDQVWVADGNYSSMDTGDAAVPVLIMKDEVDVYGGFSGNVDSTDQRAPWIYRTILDGLGSAQRIVDGANNVTLSGFGITGAVVPDTSIPSSGGTDVGGILAGDKSNFRFVDNEVYGNTTVVGGTGGATPGLGMSNGEVTNCIFRDNTGQLAPLFIFRNSTGDVRISNSLFYGNSNLYGGGAVASGNGNVYFDNCTFANNSSSNVGGWLYVEQGAVSQTGNTYITNTIAWGNNKNYYTWKPITITYSDIQEAVAGTGNINTDPLFIDAANDNYQLSSTSPCIDTGDNTAVSTSYDLDGNDRILDGPDGDTTATVDMGVSEY
jgi:hypothetical protein